PMTVRFSFTGRSMSRYPMELVCAVIGRSPPCVRAAVVDIARSVTPSTDDVYAAQMERSTIPDHDDAESADASCSSRTDLRIGSVRTAWRAVRVSCRGRFLALR